MKLYWIMIRFLVSYLLIWIGIDTGLWAVIGIGILIGLPTLSEFFMRLTRAVYVMKE